MWWDCRQCSSLCRSKAVLPMIYSARVYKTGRCIMSQYVAGRVSTFNGRCIKFPVLHMLPTLSVMCVARSWFLSSWIGRSVVWAYVSGNACQVFAIVIFRYPIQSIVSPVIYVRINVTTSFFFGYRLCGVRFLICLTISFASGFLVLFSPSSSWPRF